MELPSPKEDSLINEYGCDPNGKGVQGYSVLHCAYKRDSVNLVQNLIQEHNADINARDDKNSSPLFTAAGYGKTEIALYLLKEFGYDSTLTGYLGRNLLHC